MEDRTAWCEILVATVRSNTGDTAEIHASAPVAPIKFGDQPPPLTSNIDPDFCGFLVKSPSINKVDDVTHKRWQRRWFVLKGCFLYYFTGADRSDMKGAIDIKTCVQLAPHVLSTKRGCIFSLKCDDREYFMQAETDEVRQGWIGALVEAAQASAGVVAEEGAAAASVPPPEPEPEPEPEAYTGKRAFPIQFENKPGLLEIRPPRLNLIQKVQQQTRQGMQIVQSTTNTWPLAQLWFSGYTEEAGVFSFAGGQLDEVPGKVYRFILQPGECVQRGGGLCGVCTEDGPFVLSVSRCVG